MLLENGLLMDFKTISYLVPMAIGILGSAITACATLGCVIVNAKFTEQRDQRALTEAGRKEQETRQLLYVQAQLERFYGPALLIAQRIVFRNANMRGVGSQVLQAKDSELTKQFQMALENRAEQDFFDDYRKLRSVIVDHGWLSESSTKEHFGPLFEVIDVIELWASNHDLKLFGHFLSTTYCGMDSTIKELVVDLEFHYGNLSIQLGNGKPHDHMIAMIGPGNKNMAPLPLVSREARSPSTPQKLVLTKTPVTMPVAASQTRN
jgi:hypothetical protein